MLEDVAPLMGCSALESLAMRNCPSLKSAASLGGCKKLAKLDFTESNIKTLAGLGDCEALEELQCGSCKYLVDASGSLL